MRNQAAIFVLIIGVFSAVQCSNTDSALGANTRNFYTGIGPVWKNYPSATNETIGDMMLHLNEAGDMVLAQTSWRDNINSSGNVPVFFNDLLVVWPGIFGVQIDHVSFGINFYNQQTREAQLKTMDNPVNDWTNTDAQNKYKQAALSLCSAFAIKYLALALEVNVYGIAPDGSKPDYDRFVGFYKTLYDEIKIQHPEIMVFVTFQLEHLKGLGDNTWGYSVGEHWDFLDDFDGKLDLIALTSYPEFEYDTPGEIPDDYYIDILSNLPKNLYGKPVAFTEIGWSSRSSQQAQVDFLNRFLDLTKGLDIEYVNWVFMHDASAVPVNERLNLGLKSHNGTVKKLIWNKWKALRDLRYLK